MSNPKIPTTLADVFEESRDNSISKKPFLVTGNSTITYGMLASQVLKLSTLFRQMNLKSGDRAIVATVDDIAAATLTIALASSGIGAIIVDPETKAKRAGAFINIATPAAFFLDEGLPEAWSLSHENTVRISQPAQQRGVLFEKLLGKKMTVVPAENGTSFPAVLDRLQEGAISRDVDPASDAIILFTSGTTSRPKGVRLSHRSIVKHLGTLSRQFNHGPGSRILNILPLHHTDGLTNGLMITLMNRATIYRPFRFNIQHISELLDTVYREKITHFVTVPTILSLIQKLGTDYHDAFDTEEFKCIVCSAAPLEARLWEIFENEFKTRIANMYGLTESVTGGLFAGPGDGERRIGTVGKPVDCEAMILDAKGSPSGDGESGELLLRGENIMSGYLNAPKETAEVLRDGWFHTGDLATRDGDGFYRIVGRKKTLIISGGINVHPEEVTEVLNAIPGVVEAVAFGMEDEMWGERVTAAVVPENNTLTEALVVEHCRKHLEHAKVPHRIFFLPDLPKGPAGKVRLDEIKKIAAGNSSATSKQNVDNLRSELFSVASAAFRTKVDDLKPSSGPENTAGWDSLAHMEFVAGLEKVFNVRLSTAEIMKIQRLSDAETIISKKLKLTTVINQ